MPDTDNLATTAGAVTILYGNNEHDLWLQDKKQMEDIRDHFNKAVDKYKDFEATDHSCDVYVTNLMDFSDVTPDNWPAPESHYVGPSKGNPNYIDELKDQCNESPFFGTNVMMMEGGNKYPDQPHMAYVLNDFMSETMTVTHFVSDQNGGEVETLVFGTQKELEKHFGYEKFYYLGVDTVK